MEFDDLERKDALPTEEEPAPEEKESPPKEPDEKTGEDPCTFSSFERYEFKMDEPVVAAPEPELPATDEIAPLNVEPSKDEAATEALPGEATKELTEVVESPPVEPVASEPVIELEPPPNPEPKPKKAAKRKRTTRKRTDKPKAKKKAKPRKASKTTTARKTRKKKTKA